MSKTTRNKEEIKTARSTTTKKKPPSAGVVFKTKLQNILPLVTSVSTKRKVGRALPTNESRPDRIHTGHGRSQIGSISV